MRYQLINTLVQELLIVASLGRIVLDIIRYETILGKEGLPFGLLGAASAFKDISFFFTPVFWYSRNAISSSLRRLWLTTILFVCGLIAVFAGPSSALLMIPNIEPTWPAGGADFWLIGNNSTLWPSSLDSSSAGGPFCLNPTAQMLSEGALNSSGCIWYSTSAIAQAFQAWHLHKFYNISITETTYKHTVGVIPSDPTYNDTWALSSNPAAGLLSDQLAAVWQEAVYHAPVTQKSTRSSYHNFDFRIYEGTIAKVQTKLPAVRTRCILWDNTFDNTKFLGVFDHTFHLFLQRLISN
jgi:hypothetical protein